MNNDASHHLHNAIEWVMHESTLWKYYKCEMLFFPFSFVMQVWRMSNNERFNVFWGGNNQQNIKSGIVNSWELHFH